MNRSWLLGRACWWLLLAAGALTACGGGGGGGASDPTPPVTAPPVTATPIVTAAANFFPLDANLRLLYATSSGSEPVLVSVIGPQTSVSGVSGTAIRRREFTTGTVADAHRVYVVGGGGVRQYAVPGADAIERAFDGTDLMRWPAAAGESFVQLDRTIDSERDYDNDGRSDLVALRSVVTAVALEAVLTAADAFANTLHHRQVLTQTLLPSGGGASTTVEITTDTWFGPGYGPVKRVVTQRSGGTTTTTTESVQDYRVGALTSKDYSGPRPAGTGPIGIAPGTTRASVTYSEFLNREAIKPDTLTLRTSAGVLVPGTVRVMGRQVEFTPGQPLATGVYYASVRRQDVQDVFENEAFEEANWFFIVDATAPGIVATFPSDDAINVALTSTVAFTFSEDVGRTSANSTNTRLLSDGVVVPSTVTVNGNGVTITPTGGLQRGRRYSAEISGVTDTVGNVMVGSRRLTFDTTPGRLAASERLYPDGIFNGSNFAHAVGDFDGDGRPDVLMTLPDGPFSEKLYIRKGRADGSLSPIEPVPAAPLLGCPLTALSIGDFNGDGRADVAVGSSRCGVLVLLQTAAGTLEAGPRVADAAVDVLRMVDIDGDGRPDLAGTGQSATAAYVWRQTPAGQLELLHQLDLGGERGRDLEVGDLDGDGRPDLVVSLNVDFGPRHLAIFRQQPGGGFAAPAYLSVGASGARALALGDLNGDGRLDIVATTGRNAPTAIAVLYQAADRSFGTVTAVPSTDVPWAVRIADIDRDGRLDIVVSHYAWSQVGLYMQRPDGSLSPEELYDGPRGTILLQSLVVADVDADGLPDIVLAGELLRQVPLAGRGALAESLQRASSVRGTAGVKPFVRSLP